MSIINNKISHHQDVCELTRVCSEYSEPQSSDVPRHTALHKKMVQVTTHSYLQNNYPI